jgi:hypothetical protein
MRALLIAPFTIIGGSIAARWLGFDPVLGALLATASVGLELMLFRWMAKA